MAPAESSVATLTESASRLHLVDEQQKKLALVQAEWQLGSWAALFNRLAYQPKNWFCSSRLFVVLRGVHTAALLGRMLFAADWQPSTFSPEK